MGSRARSKHRVRCWLPLLCLAAWAWAADVRAASDAPLSHAAVSQGGNLPASWGQPVIPPGMERRVIGLIAPHAMGDTLHGVSIGDIHIRRTEVQYDLVGPDRSSALILRSHQEASETDRAFSRSFVLLRQCDDPCPEDAFAALEAAIRANDDGTFWTRGTWVLDGTLHLALALLLLAFVLRRQLRESPRHVFPALLGIVVLGAILRLLLSVEAPMTAWPYERVPPLILTAIDGLVLPALTKRLEHPPGVVELIFQGNFLLAALTPLAVFAHARYLLGDHRKALAAALLLALLPSHIRFSRSDVFMIQSLATASLTFVVIYTALLDRSRLVRFAFLLLVPLTSVMTYRVRPENVALALVDLLAVYVVSDKGVPLRRQLTVGSVIAATAAYAFLAEFLQKHGETLALGLSFDTLVATVRTFFSPRLNTFINPFVTPPWILLLAVLGGLWLWKNGERRRTLFVLVWFFGYLFIHSIVESTTAMQARYHLQLVTPFLMLAAAAVPVVLAWNRRRQAVLAALLLASPLLHAGFIRDTNYYEMEEFAFLRASSRAIPDGCTVLEFSPAYHLYKPAEINPSRLRRFAQRLENGRVRERFTVINTGVLPQRGAEAEVMTDEARAILDAPPPCLFVYEGLTCRSHRPVRLERAPVCTETLSRLDDFEAVATTEFRARAYDGPFLSRLEVGPDEAGIREGDTVSLRLYRVRSVRASPMAGVEGSGL